MLQKVKNSQRVPKGDRLNWISVKDLKETTLNKLGIQGSKVYTSEKQQFKNCKEESNSKLLIP